MKKVIVTTTINHPTEAIEKFDHMKDWTLVVIGDLKTPKDYRLKNGIYVSPSEQEKYDQKLSDVIGWNYTSRRNFGFLWAYDMKADVIAVVDDDNIPYEYWGENLLLGKDIQVNYYETELECFDPIGATNYPHLWHRGYPLQLIPDRNYAQKTLKTIQADVQADFWNGDPDIDAICRLEHRPACEFDAQYFPIASNKMAPFNSQNTFITREVLPHYFMLPQTGRMEDIWIAYYVQSLGFKVVFGKPSVMQKRNVQDIRKNLRDEFLGYEKSYDLVKSFHDGKFQREEFWPPKACHAFELYQKHFKIELQR